MLRRLLLLVLLFLFIARPVFAQVAVDGTAEVSITGGTVAAVDLTTSGANRVLIACVTLNHASATISSFTYGGQALSQITRIDHSLTSLMLELWIKVNPLVGLNSLSVTSSDSTNIDLGGVSFTGADQVTPLGTPVTSQDSAIDPVTDDVAGDANGIVVDCIGVDPNSASPSVGANQTDRFNTERLAGSTEGGAGTRTMSWTNTSGQYNSHIAVLVNPAAAGSSQHRITVIEE
jgi:hypothetical protein